MSGLSPVERVVKMVTEFSLEGANRKKSFEPDMLDVGSIVTDSPCCLGKTEQRPLRARRRLFGERKTEGRGNCATCGRGRLLTRR